MSDLSQVQAKLEQARTELEAVMHLAGGSEPKEEKVKKPSAERAADTLFRSAYRVQMDLTALADNKANMMISINGIVMSIIIASVAPKLDNNPWLLLPTVVLLVGNLVSLVYAVMAARPRLKSPALNPPIRHHARGRFRRGHDPLDRRTATRLRNHDAQHLWHWYCPVQEVPAAAICLYQFHGCPGPRHDFIHDRVCVAGAAVVPAVAYFLESN
jgi:hypothetical protein